jgi:hypothetical protein
MGWIVVPYENRAILALTCLVQFQMTAPSETALELGDCQGFGACEVKEPRTRRRQLQ